ncbi:MAG: TauD/TfdA family dioxygenase [Proteobacteria bacterium]|nr:MAG: TauD/TfdA family dioxygenase [Pseudomonadota bacterium]
MRIEPIKEHIGATIEVSRSQLGDADVAAACREALAKYGVLVFPKIGVTDEEQLLFTDLIGKRLDFSSKVDGGKHGTDGVYTVTLNPEINRQQEYIKGTYFWHMDGLTVPEQPPKATLLSGRKLSATGGNTHFASTYAAYEGLSDEDKAEIADLRVIHELAPYLTAIVENPTQEELDRWNAAPTNEYPLVWTHESGRKSLVMGYTAHHVKGLDLASGKALLQRLHDWAGQPKYTYVHKWSEGDLVIWDNYGTLHRATPYAVDSGREMHRTTISATETLQ